MLAGSLGQGMTPPYSTGGSPCSGALARPGGSSPESPNPSVTYIPSLSSLHLLPSTNTSWTLILCPLQPGQGPGGSGAGQLRPPRAEQPQPGTALGGNQIFTRGALAAAGLGAREPLQCHKTPVVPPGRAHVGFGCPHSPFPPHHGQPLQEGNPEPRDCRHQIPVLGFGFWTPQNGPPMGARVWQGVLG